MAIQKGNRKIWMDCYSPMGFMNNLKYEKCGKIIVAYKEEEFSRLEVLMERGKANLVQGLEIIGPERIREIEPNAVGLKALYAPNTAIVNYSEISELFAKNIKAI